MKQSAYRLGYRGDIEGLRGIAIFLVVAVHAGVPWLQGGFIGVDVFFVLSGFLITGLLIQENATTGKVRFLSFYIRRLRRLLPALFFMLLVVSLLAALLLAPAEQARQSLAASMVALWSSNIHFAFTHLGYFAPSARTNLFLHTWSLGVEEQFYLVWPVLLVLLLGRGKKRSTRRLKFGMWAVVIISLIACVILTDKAQRFAFYMMPSRAWQFGVGALIWLHFMTPAKEKLQNHVTSYHVIAGWLGFALIAFASFWFSAYVPYPGARALLPTLGAAGIIAAGCTRTHSFGITRVISWRPLQWLGHVSYSWYLWHWPILILGAALVGSHAPAYQALWVVLSLIIACISYALIESPIRQQKHWLLHPRTTLFAGLALMALASGICLRWNQQASTTMHSPQYQRFEAAHDDAPLIYAKGCDSGFHSAHVYACILSHHDAQHTVVLIGDSHAGQWAPTVKKVFDHPGWRLIIFTKSACPMADEPFFYRRIGSYYKKCAVWREHAIKDVTLIKPDIILMASSAGYFSKKKWIEGTRKVLEKLSPAAGHIYIFHDTLHLIFDGPNCLAEHVGRPDWLNLRHTCTMRVKNTRDEAVANWIKTAAVEFQNISMINMNKYICPHRTCAAERNGMVVFRDSQHMTRSFAATLAPELAQELGMQKILATNTSTPRHSDVP